MEQAKHTFHKGEESASTPEVDSRDTADRVSRLEEKIDVLKSALIELGYALAKCELPIAPRRHIETFRKLMDK